MDPPIQVKMRLELVIQPGMFEVFQSVAIATGIDYKITTDDLQRWKKFEVLVIRADKQNLILVGSTLKNP